MRKLLLTAVLFSISALASANAQELSIRDTITDSHIIYPASIDQDTHSMYDNWYLRRYAVLDSVAKRATKQQPTDEIYIDRLQRLPNVIEMPYNSIVRDYITMYADRKPQLVERMLALSLYYMPIFDDAIEKYNAPCELRYLPIIESALDPTATSRVGAAGLWQFMASTATGEGLEVNSLVDERRDPIASSDAAVHYLTVLHNMYDDWTLAIAAYNCGPGNVNKAIKKAGDVKDYWAIYQYLPQETRGYIPAFIAANYIMNYYAEHGISHVLARRPVSVDTVHVGCRVHLQQVADVMGIPIEDLRMLNPQYRADIIPGNIKPYTLILPSAQAYCFNANLGTITNHRADEFGTRVTVEPYDPRTTTVHTDAKGQYVEDLVVVTHTVRRGETLKTIASKYGVTVESLQKANGISGTKVKQGRKIKVNTYQKRYLTPEEAETQMTTDSIAAPATPVVEPEKEPAPAKPQVSEPVKPSAPAAQAPQYTTYTVKKGDTLSKIATAHGVTIQQIKTANGLKSDKINVGQKLKIPKKKSSSRSRSRK